MADKPNPQPRITRQEDVVRKLQQRAVELGTGGQLPQFRTLRDELGVSGTTLTAALNDLERQGVILRRHGVGIFVSERLHHRHIVLLADPVFFQGDASPFWEMLVRSARTRATEKAEDLTLHFIRASSDKNTAEVASLIPESLAGEFEEQRVHGILGVGLPYALAEEIVRRGIPFVAFAGYGPCSVAFDHAGTVRLGVEALADQGCRRIALWSSVSPQHPTCREEVLSRPTVAAFQNTLAARGLAFDPALVRLNAHLCPDYHAGVKEFFVPTSQEQGRQTVLEVFGPVSDPRLRPDGIVCSEDTMMQGALPQLARLNLWPGVDVQIATHANAGSPVLFGYEDALFRMEVSPADLVREMYDLLETQWRGDVPENPRRCIEPKLLPPQTAK